MATNQTLLKSARLFHLYSGVFLAPALLFFAFTGGVQTFSLHETTRGNSYKPPAILVELGQLHKKQTLVVPVKKGPPPGEAKPGDRAVEGRERKPEGGGAAGAPPPTAAAGRVHRLWPMKIFFLVAAVGLFLSTLTGVYMAYRFARRQMPISLTLLAGIVVPLLLLLF